LPVTVKLPAVRGVKVTAQLPELRLQLVELNDPVADPAAVKLTVLVGVLEIPEEAVSVTVAVQVEPLFARTDEGEQVTAVELERAVTVSVNDCDPVLMLGL
jgi:hypothetical protein